jgi:hypothetical protein
VLGGFDEQEVEHVMQLKKWINENPEWKPSEGYQRFRVPVGCEEAYALQLIGTFNPNLGNYTYVLLLGTQPIRRLDVGKAHHNPQCDRVGPHHKHTWTDAHSDRWAYEPDDIDFTDLETAFHGFLKECGIGFSGRLTKPVVHKELFQL